MDVTVKNLMAFWTNESIMLRSTSQGVRTMTRPIRIGVQLSPGGAPHYPAAVIHAEEIGVDVIFGSDHFHRPQ